MARASGGTWAGANACGRLTATSRLRESGDESPHSKTLRLAAGKHEARTPRNSQPRRLRYQPSGTRAGFGVRGLVTAFTRRLVAVGLREAWMWNGAFTARASAGTRAGADACGHLTATNRLRESGDKSPHSKTRRLAAGRHGARTPRNSQPGRLRYQRGRTRVGFGVRGLVTALSRRLVAVGLREAWIWNGAFTARASAGTRA